MSDVENPELDLVITRTLPVRRSLIWRAWTEPEHLKEWWVPKPWTVDITKLDVRPGGGFNSIFRGPNGEEFPNQGVFLEVVEQEKLVFTDTLLEGWRPSQKPFFTGIITMEDVPDGTRYTARALHGNPETLKQHEEMGFYEGWGTTIDQLAAYAPALG